MIEPSANSAIAIANPVSASCIADGFVDEINLQYITGWLRNLADPRETVAFNLVIARPDSIQIIGSGIADDHYPGLADDTISGSHHGFRMALSPYLTKHERDHLQIHIPAANNYLRRAPDMQGFIDERSNHHVTGWIRNRFDPIEKISVEFLLSSESSIVSLGTTKANRFYPPLAGNGRPGYYGFQFFFPRPLNETEREQLIVRPVGSSHILECAPNLNTYIKIISFVAMDIVNNCNLRCPFCLFDYTDVKSTKFMSLEVFDTALKLIPFVDDGNFWLSCLHEPSLHPNFLKLIDRIPRQWRHKVMFTTNIAKRAPASYFEALADSGVHHINISLESLNPEIFERMRKGARFPIFKQNWDHLLAAWRAHKNPPDLVYIIMAYQSNLRDIPGLVKHLLDNCLANKIDIRYTYDMDHIDPAFRAAEYLTTDDWDWLERELRAYDPAKICLSRPPRPLAEPLEKIVVFEAMGPGSRQLVKPAQNPLSEAITMVERGAEFPLNMEVRWDGEIIISGDWDHPAERRVGATGNILDVDDIYQCLVNVPARPKIQGYLDEITDASVSGWVRNLYDPHARVEVTVCINIDGKQEIIAQGIADRPYPALLDTRFGDANYGFTIALDQPLTQDQANSLVIVPEGTADPLQRAPQYQGFIDELSERHVAGWVRDRFDPSCRLTVDIIVRSEDGGSIIGSTLAQRFCPVLDQINIGNGYYGFRYEFPASIPLPDRQHITVRPRNSSATIEISPRLISQYQPFESVAVELTSSFPLLPWLSQKKAALDAEILSTSFHAALKFLPAVQKGGFTLGYRSEPMAHPHFAELLVSVPQAWRQKISINTALSVYLPNDAIHTLARSGIYAVTIWLESFSSDIAAIVRSESHASIFLENWQRLLTAIKSSGRPPKLRYHLTVFPENFKELPALVSYLGDAGMASSITVETPRSSEIKDEKLSWLREQLAGYATTELMLLLADHHRSEFLIPENSAKLPKFHTWLTQHEQIEHYPLSAYIGQNEQVLIYSRWESRSLRRFIAQCDINEINDLINDI